MFIVFVNKTMGHLAFQPSLLVTLNAAMYPKYLIQVRPESQKSLVQKCTFLVKAHVG